MFHSIKSTSTHLHVILNCQRPLVPKPLEHVWKADFPIIGHQLPCCHLDCSIWAGAAFNERITALLQSPDKHTNRFQRCNESARCTSSPLLLCERMSSADGTTSQTGAHHGPAIRRREDELSALIKIEFVVKGSPVLRLIPQLSVPIMWPPPLFGAH